MEQAGIWTRLFPRALHKANDGVAVLNGMLP